MAANIILIGPDWILFDPKQCSHILQSSNICQSIIDVRMERYYMEIIDVIGFELEIRDVKRVTQIEIIQQETKTGRVSCVGWEVDV